MTQHRLYGSLHTVTSRRQCVRKWRVAGPAAVLGLHRLVPRQAGVHLRATRTCWFLGARASTIHAKRLVKYGVRQLAQRQDFCLRLIKVSHCNLSNGVLHRQIGK